MPCVIDGDASIPIAQFGRSNIGRMKTIYREGLGVRYGRVMQAISGVHFNYSFPEKLWDPWAAARESRETSQDFMSASYFDLLRNYRRLGWIVLYLFGVSPAVCKSFLRARGVELPEFGKGTAWEPYATSLRMSDLGYRNRNQAGVEVSVNSLEEYVRDLTRAITTPNPDYEQLGVKVDGQYRQLNANLLQIENEYYSFIRPKRVARSGERPTKALRRAGVEYVEVRALDVSAFDPVGVNQNKLRFLEAFLVLCLTRDSPPIDGREQAALDQNHVVGGAARPRAGTHAEPRGRPYPMLDWARELLDQMQGICELLDARRPDPALCRGARGSGGETRRRRADAVGAADQGAARHRRIVLRSRAAHVGAAQELFPRPVSAERGAARRVCRRGRRIARGAARDRCRAARSVRGVPRRLPRLSRAGVTATPATTSLATPPGRR